jgi:hypothetical protein
MLMPYGQKKEEKSISIDIYALWAKEKTQLNHFLRPFSFIDDVKPDDIAD